MTTDITRVTGTPDTTLPPVIPSLGMQVDHFWHPRSYVAGATTWRDEVGLLDLTVTGTAADVTKETVTSGRPFVHLKSTASFIRTGVPASEIRTFLVIAKPMVGDVQTGFSYVANLGQAGISHDVGADVVTTVPATANIPALRDNWHMYGMLCPATLLFSYAVDGNSQTLGSAAAGDNSLIRLGHSSSQKRELRVAAVAASTQTYTASQLTGTIFPAVKAWFSDLWS